jgi:hypothetical protein
MAHDGDRKLESLITLAARDDDAFAQVVAAYG